MFSVVDLNSEDTEDKAYGLQKSRNFNLTLCSKISTKSLVKLNGGG